MALESINLFGPDIHKVTNTQMPLSFEIKGDESGGDSNSFVTTLNGIIEQMSTASNEKEKLTSALIQGKDIDIHSIMVAQTKIEVLSSLASTVMSKATTAYQTLMNLQI